MQNAAETRTALPLRSHTILGVCEGIGEDFGFNPAWLRVPLAASVLISLKYAVAAYLLLGIIVLGSRLLFPQPKPTVDSMDAIEASAQADEAEAAELPLAA
ncbi:PspC domain-containing protein [Sphingomonas sp.]|uniref:PspC domain-containing protein n=1 Tax=Sphingomonas sp. TaxID=28214 RepID=UPI0025EB130F|nr:PspC domain-containing protein [Sphingomonas sp.]MBV9529434.1 PspC domain-containing protein [Sphingomonas sp.]